MQLKFNVSDHLYEQFVLKYGVSGTYARMRKILEEMVDVDANDRYFIVAGDDRRALEAIFERTIESSKQLAMLTKKLNTVKIGKIEVGFTDDELARLRTQAGFHGKSFEQYMRETVATIKTYLMDGV